MNMSDYLYLRTQVLKNYVSGERSINYLIDKIVYVNELPTYIGIAKKGSATSDAAWIVTKLSYDANNNCTGSTISDENQIMDNYLTLTYS